jgi:Cyclin, N-terminal domain/WW domain
MPESSKPERSENSLLHSFLSDLSFWEHRPVPTTQKSVYLDDRPKDSKVEAGRKDTMTVAVATASRPIAGGRHREGPRSTETLETLQASATVWRTAVDPSSGRTYYYHSSSYETTWDKPQVVAEYERRMREELKRKTREFFAEMERNIQQSLLRKERIPGIPANTNLASLMTVLRKSTSPIANQPLLNAKSFTPQRSLEPPVSDTPQPHELTKPPPARIRTISSMNEGILAQVSSRSVTPTNDETSSSRARNAGSSDGVSVTREGRPPMAPPRMRTSSRDNVLPTRPRSAVSSASPETGDDDDLAGEGFVSTPVVLSNKTPAEEGQPPSVPRPSAISQTHSRRNTGGTIYVQSTMSNPDVDNTIKCVCAVFRAHIVQSAEREPNQHCYSPVSVSASNATATGALSAPIPRDVFCDDYEATATSAVASIPVSPPPPRSNALVVPSLQELETFYLEFYRRSQMEHDTIIMSLIYVERLIKETHGSITPHPNNWKSILFSCMVLSSKVWDDLSMWNIDFSNVSAAAASATSSSAGAAAGAGLATQTAERQVANQNNRFAYFSLQRINQLELAVLSSLNFDVRVPASE